MATHDWMKGEPSEQPSPRRRARAIAAGREQRSPLEVGLAVSGLAAWMWCAYEVLAAFLK